MAARTRALLFAALLGPLAATTAHAQPAQAAAPSHVRPLTNGLAVLLADAERQSPTVRALIDIIDRSDLVVYVQSRVFSSRALTGRIVFLGASDVQRYVLVEIAARESWRTQLGTLGHELRHAVEVADATWIRSIGDFAVHYRQEIRPRSFEVDRDVFETAAAVDAGHRVLHEMDVAGTRAR